jgi:hypothetical protein
MARPPRSRRARREQDRALRKEVRRVEELAARLPGGTPERPIDVGAASVVEVKARATPCPQCGGELQLESDRAEPTPRGLLRALGLACRVCHAPRTIWFRVASGGPN